MLENKSENSVFIQSQFVNFQNNFHPASVVKVPADSALILFDYKRFDQILQFKQNDGYESVLAMVLLARIKLRYV